MTGGAVYDYVKDFTTGQGYVTTDGANIDVDGSNSKWLSKLGTQPVRQPFLMPTTTS